MKKIIAPSFLAADIWQAAAQVSAIEQAGCQYLHLDIMDGHFVPNISFGPGLVKCLRPHSQMVFDTHLMVEDADFFFDDFAAAGADILTVHADLVLLMSVNPGFGGQKFIRNTLPRLQKLAQMRSEQGLDFLIEVDGGVDASNIKEIAVAGADILVAGSAVFGKEDPAAAYQELTRLANQ